MSPANFKRRTSALQIPQDIYDLYDTVVSECSSCQKFSQAPQRSKVTGMRANNFADLWFLDHVEINVDNYLYLVLVIIDASSNFVWALPQKTKEQEETMSALTQACYDLNAWPRAVCGDQFFMTEQFKRYYAYHNMKLSLIHI